MAVDYEVYYNFILVRWCVLERLGQKILTIASY